VSVRGALLQLLSEGDRHGYQLKVDFESRTGGVWPLNVGQVYTTLDRMARDGVVTEAEGSGTADQRVYRITEDGRGELKSWLAASPVAKGPVRDELVVKVLMAVGGDAAAALQVVDDQRAALLSALQTGRRRQRGLPDEDVAEQLARDVLLARVEADLAWLDRCEERLLSQLPERKRRT
jgi:DNA-binding PadR family transcriptional regulator